MGAPIFKYRELFERHGVTTFSANFELYGDISERISALLTSITPYIENYSVDEAFLDLTNLDIAEYQRWGQQVRATVLHHIGIPVSIGIAPSKTLCKLAADWVKKHPETQGALYWPERGDELLKSFDVHDIWGVGWRLAPRLKAQGIQTAFDVSNLPPRQAQQLMGIHGRHMVYELNGVSCLPLQTHTKPQQIISRGRQFGQDTREERVVEAAITTLMSRAAHELRREGQLARTVAVALRTNRHKPGYSSTFEAIQLTAPSADTGTLCSYAARAAKTSYQSGLEYHKAEVFLYNLTPTDSVQIDVFGAVDTDALTHETNRMAAFDAINAKHGPGSVRPAAEILSEQWRPKRNMLSPRYTSVWEELPEARLARYF